MTLDVAVKGSEQKKYFRAFLIFWSFNNELKNNGKN